MTTKPLYSNCKLLHHVETLGDCNPIMAILFPTNVCNFRCKWCIYYAHPKTDEFDPKDQWSYSSMTRFVHLLADNGCKAVQISGGGEPMAYQHIKHLIVAIEKQGMEWGLITNGTFPEKITGHPMWIRISLDAGTDRTWQKCHETALDWFPFKDGLEWVVRRHGKYTTIGASFVIHKSNARDIRPAAALSKQLGFSYIRYTYALTPDREKYFAGDWMSKVYADVAIAKRYESSDFRVIDQVERIDLMRHDITTHRPRRCYYGEHVPVIGANGVLYPCCELSYMKKYSLVDLKSKDLPHNEILTEACPPCDMSEKNEDIERMIEMRDACTHYNFL